MAAPKKVSFLVQTADPVVFIPMNAGEKLVFAHNYGQTPWQVNGNGVKPDGSPGILVADTHYEVGGDTNTVEITMKSAFAVSFYVRWVKPAAPVDQEIVGIADPRLAVISV